MNKYNVDFAISYAGEDVEIAKKISESLRELSFVVFLGDEQRRLLVGVDGETFFEQLFTEAKQVIALISKSYRAKEWTRYEWDVICSRGLENRYIPIRLDDTRIKGLSSNVLYCSWTEDNIEDVVGTCISQLLLFEKNSGINRPTAFERIMSEIQTGSRGSVAKAYQLVVDKRERTPLADAEYPKGAWEPRYKIVEELWQNFSKVKRLCLKVRLPQGLPYDEIVFNLKHCCIQKFNNLKPDAVSVCAYTPEANINNAADIAVLEFAPYGEWSRAEEGFAYNLPTSEFDFRFTRMSLS